MKTNSKRLTYFLICALGCFTIPAFAADAPSSRKDSAQGTSSDKDRQGTTPTDEAVILGRVEKLSDVTGAVVLQSADNSGKKIGKIDDLGVDITSGRIVNVIVSVGGLAGIGDRLISIPPTSLRYDDSPGAFRVLATEEQLKTSPLFDQTQWSEHTKPERVVEVYRHFQAKPYFTVVYEPADNAEPRVIRLGAVVKASDLIGMKVKNNSGETLGTVNTLMIDLPAGRVVAAIISSGGVLGIGKDLFAMPPSLFVLNQLNKTLDADISLDTLKGIPSFKEWPEKAEAGYVESIYQAFNVAPYFQSDKATARPGSSTKTSDQGLTPFDQGNSKADISTTAAIRKALLRQGDLSVNGHNVKIITIDGKVTLRGEVNNEAEREQIFIIANQVAGAGKVANELTIQPSATKAPPQ